MEDTEVRPNGSAHEHHHHHSSSSSHHHRHSSHHGFDDAETFKQQQLRASRRRKAFLKWLYRAMCVTAFLIVLAVIYLYFIA